MSLLNLSNTNRTIGVDAHANASNLHEQRIAAEEALEDQEEAKRYNAAATGVSAGVATAAVAGGPAGILVGVGLAAAGMFL